MLGFEVQSFQRFWVFGHCSGGLVRGTNRNTAILIPETPKTGTSIVRTPRV